MILLTATPHSGKPEEFHSLLGLLQPEFEKLDLPTSSQNQRRELARHFIQRKRGDVEKWMGEDTPFPTRDAFEADYSLTLGYRNLFEEILDFAKQLITVDPGKVGQRRIQYWTALALLRGVMSSPAAGVEMLNTRLSNLAKAAADETAWTVDALDENPVRDTEFGFEGDNTPIQLIEQNDWSATQRQKLRAFAQQLAALSTIKDDKKLATAEALLQEWLAAGFNPVIFCRYIATANYVGELLAPALKKKFPKLDIQVITSELPDELRKQKIEEMGTHSGIPWLRYLRKNLGDRIHFWPFDGWEIPSGKSAIVEVYPSLWSKGFAREDRTQDQHDAYSVATWLRQADRDGKISTYFNPHLTPAERTVAQVEGWILGIM